MARTLIINLAIAAALLTFVGAGLSLTAGRSSTTLEEIRERQAQRHEKWCQIPVLAGLNVAECREIERARLIARQLARQ